MAGAAGKEGQPFPGCEQFNDQQVASLQRTLNLVKELQSPESIRAIVEKTGVGGWLPNGFPDYRGLAHIESRVAVRCRGIVAMETAHVLGESVSPKEVIELVLSNFPCEEVPGKVYTYLSQRRENSPQ